MDMDKQIVEALILQEMEDLRLKSQWDIDLRDVVFIKGSGRRFPLKLHRYCKKGRLTAEKTRQIKEHITAIADTPVYGFGNAKSNDIALSVCGNFNVYICTPYCTCNS